MKIFWFDEPIGIKIFRKVGDEYYKIHGAYPRTLTELPDFLNYLGFIVEAANIGPPDNQYERKGILMSEEIATALILRFG
jgi:hypothetical protein